MTDIKPEVKVTDLPDASPSDPLEALSWLGETVEEIAEGLRARKIQGRKSDADSCPLANYLSIFWPDSRICVGGRVLFIDDVQFTGQDALGEFVGRFDSGMLPDLVETEPWQGR